MTRASPELVSARTLESVFGLLALDDEAKRAFARAIPDRMDALLIRNGAGEPAGCAIFSVVPNPLTGGQVTILTHLSVHEDQRGQGFGKALVIALAALCVERGQERLDWSLDRLDLDARTFFDLMAPGSFHLNRLVYSIDDVGLAKLAGRIW